MFRRPDTSFPNMAKGLRFKYLFPSIDRNGDGKISKEEWDAFVVQSKKQLAAMRQPGLVAIRPGEKGEVAESPLFLRDHLLSQAEHQKDTVTYLPGGSSSPSAVLKMGVS